MHFTTKTKANLGFGTAPTSGALGRRQTLELLDAAYQAGIRHFDTAPLYGWGAGETILGAFARGKSDLTIVTKAGIDPPTLMARMRAKALRRVAEARFNRLGAGQVRRSAESSLSRLGVERLGALLLHEPAATDVSDELVRALEDLKRTGKAAAIGLAGRPAEMVKILARYPDTFDIVQAPCTGIDQVAPYAGRAQWIVHSALNPALEETLALLATDPERAVRFEAENGVHSGDRAGVARLLLRAALARVPDGVVLFSSSKVERIRSNAQLTPAAHTSLESLRPLTAPKRHAQKA